MECEMELIWTNPFDPDPLEMTDQELEFHFCKVDRPQLIKDQVALTVAEHIERWFGKDLWEAKL